MDYGMHTGYDVYGQQMQQLVYQQFMMQQAAAAQQDQVDFHSWKNYDMIRFKQVVTEGHGSLIHVYHSDEGKRSRHDALYTTDSCFGDFFNHQVRMPEALDQWSHNLVDLTNLEDYQNIWSKLFQMRQTHLVLHHFASMPEAQTALLCDFVAETDYVFMVKDGTPLLFKSFGSLDKENNPKFLVAYKAGEKEMAHKLKIKPPPKGSVLHKFEPVKKAKKPTPADSSLE